MLGLIAASLFIVWISLLPFSEWAWLRWGSLGLGSAAIGLVLMRRGGGIGVALALVTLYVALRLPYFVSSGFQLLPFGDSYWDYAVLRDFIANGHVRVVPASDSVAMQMTWYSSWPILHVATATLSAVTGLSPLATAIFMILYLGVAGLAVGCALAERILTHLGARRTALVAVLFVFAVFPENIFWSGSFVRQNYGFPLLLVLLLAILHVVEHGYSKSWSVVVYAALGTLALAHHFSSLTFLLLMVLMAGLWRLLPRFQQATPMRLERAEAWFLIGPTSVGASLIVVWWVTVADVIWEHAVSLYRRYARLIIEFDGSLFNPASIVVPDVLTPAWLVPAVVVRDVLLYGGAAGGFLYLFFRGRESRTKTFYVTLAAAFGLLFAILFFWTEPYRLLALAVPFVAVAWAYLLEHERVARPAARIAGVVAVVATTLLAGVLLWAHTFAPVHLHGPADEWPSETGEHWMGGPATAAFVAERVPYRDDMRIYADDVNPLTMTLGTESLRRMDRLGLYPEVVFLDDERVSPIALVATRDFATYEYYASVWTPIDSPAVSAGLAESLHLHADAKGDRIYDSGMGGVWILRPTSA